MAQPPLPAASELYIDGDKTSDVKIEYEASLSFEVIDESRIVALEVCHIARI